MRSNSILVSGGTPHGLNEAGADLVQGNVVIVHIMLWSLLLRQWRGFEGRGVGLHLPHHHYLYSTLDYDQDQVGELLRIKL